MATPQQTEVAGEHSSLSLSWILRGWRRWIAFSVIAGLLAGSGVAALVTLITKSLDRSPDNGGKFALAYLGLCIFVVATGICSELLVVQFAQNNLFRLRLWLSRRILSAPFQQLQAVGANRLIATLTDDISNVAGLLEALPPVLIEASTLLGALLYMGWLSRSLLLLFLAFLLVLLCHERIWVAVWRCVV